MQHFDEGTIHAWIDGQLDETEAQKLASHLAQCPECSAAVAEARGLVAGASRILGALDEVPGGVIPKPARPGERQRRSIWRDSRWITGAAAALILAVGVSTLARERPAQQGPVDERVALQPPSSSATTVLAESISDSRAKAGADPVVASARPEAHAERARTRTAPSAAEAPQAAPVAPAASAADALAAATERSDAKLAAEAARSAGLESRARLRRETLVPQVELTAARWAGACYTVQPSAAANFSASAASAAPAVAEGGRRAPQVAAAPGEPGRAVSQLPRGMIVLLDTVSVPGGRLARHIPADSVVGSWRLVADDSSRVLMRLTSGQVVVLEALQKIDCPPAPPARR